MKKPFRPEGPVEQSPGLRPQADALGEASVRGCAPKGHRRDEAKTLRSFNDRAKGVRKSHQRRSEVFKRLNRTEVLLRAVAPFQGAGGSPVRTQGIGLGGLSPGLGFSGPLGRTAAIYDRPPWV